VTPAEPAAQAEALIVEQLRDGAIGFDAETSRTQRSHEAQRMQGFRPGQLLRSEQCKGQVKRIG